MSESKRPSLSEAHLKVLQYLVKHRGWTTTATVLSGCQLSDAEGERCLEFLVKYNYIQKQKQSERFLYTFTEQGRVACGTGSSSSSTLTTSTTLTASAASSTRSTTAREGKQDREQRDAFFRKRRQDNENKVYEYVLDHSGSNTADIADALSLPTSVVNGVLYSLRKQKVVQSEWDGETTNWSMAI